MATRRTAEEDDKLTDANFEKVISLLEPAGETKAITKKDACAILGIAYNTTRLTTLIEKYKDKKAKDAQKRAEKRGTPASPTEVTFAIQSYLEGDTVDNISNMLFRGPTFVKSILVKHGVPMRNVPHNYLKPEMVPEEAIRESFKVGEVVYSMRYDCIATIDQPFSPGVYRLWLLSDKWKCYAYQEACELASLEHLRKLGVKI